MLFLLSFIVIDHIIAPIPIQNPLLYVIILHSVFLRTTSPDKMSSRYLPWKVQVPSVTSPSPTNIFPSWTLLMRSLPIPENFQVRLPDPGMPSSHFSSCNIWFSVHRPPVQIPARSISSPYTPDQPLQFHIPAWTWIPDPSSSL